MPLAGWVILSAEGDPVPFFGLELPPLVGPDKALAERAPTLALSLNTLAFEKQVEDRWRKFPSPAAGRQRWVDGRLV